MSDKRRSAKREEVAYIVGLAENLVAAHGRRNPTSENATLAEEEAIFNLRWQMNELAKRCNGGSK